MSLACYSTEAPSNQFTVGFSKLTTWNLNGILTRQQVISLNTTKMADIFIPNDELRPEYDETSLKNGVRGKYAQQYAAGTNIVCLTPDVAAAFPNEEAVNEALRFVLKKRSKKD